MIKRNLKLTSASFLRKKQKILWFCLNNGPQKVSVSLNFSPNSFKLTYLLKWRLSVAQNYSLNFSHIDALLYLNIQAEFCKIFFSCCDGISELLPGKKCWGCPLAPAAVKWCIVGGPAEPVAIEGSCRICPAAAAAPATVVGVLCETITMFRLPLPGPPMDWWWGWWCRCSWWTTVVACPPEAASREVNYVITFGIIKLSSTSENVSWFKIQFKSNGVGHNQEDQAH